MKSEIYMSAKIQDDGRVKVDMYGPANKLLPLLEEEACALFKELKDKCYPDTMEVMCLFFKNIAEWVFPDDLFERIYELAIEAAIARVNDLSSRRRTKDNAILKSWHEQAIAELTDLGRGYNQMIIDKYKELAGNGNS